MLISTLHLGKPFRAWRAILNFHSSWLSKEIGLIGFFLSSLMLMVVVIHIFGVNLPNNSGLRPLLWLIGVSALYSIDRVYDHARQKSFPQEEVFRSRPFWHSSSAVLGGSFLAGIAVMLPLSAPLPFFQGVIFCLGFLSGLTQLSLYVNRHRDQESLSPHQVALLSARVLGGFIIPIALIITQGSSWGAFLLAVLGFSIDRMEFYNDLEIESPGW